LATLTIRNGPETVKRDLRRTIAERGVSMDQEARDRFDLEKLLDGMWNVGLL
jgi:plasmid stability protein